MESSIGTWFEVAFGPSGGSIVDGKTSEYGEYCINGELFDSIGEFDDINGDDESMELCEPPATIGLCGGFINIGYIWWCGELEMRQTKECFILCCIHFWK